LKSMRDNAIEVRLNETPMQREYRQTRDREYTSARQARESTEQYAKRLTLNFLMTIVRRSDELPMAFANRILLDSNISMDINDGERD
jgi:hypothetical protein